MPETPQRFSAKYRRSFIVQQIRRNGVLSRERLYRQLNNPERQQIAEDIEFLNELGFDLEWAELGGHRYLVNADQQNLGTQPYRESVRRNQKEAIGMVAASLVLGLPPFDAVVAANIFGDCPPDELNSRCQDKLNHITPELQYCWSQQRIIAALLDQESGEDSSEASIHARRLAVRLRQIWSESSLRLYLESGTTTNRVASFLRDAPLPSPYSALASLTVCTNSAGIFHTLGNYEVPIKTIIVGGTKLDGADAIAGPLSEIFFQEPNILDFAISLVGASVVDLGKNVCCSDSAELSALKQKALQRSQIRVVLVDDSKLQWSPSREKHRFAELTPEKIDLVIVNYPLQENGEQSHGSETQNAFEKKVNRIRQCGVPVLAVRIDQHIRTLFSKEYARGREVTLHVAHDHLDRFREIVKYRTYDQSDALERFLDGVLQYYFDRVGNNNNITADTSWISTLIESLHSHFHDQGPSGAPQIPHLQDFCEFFGHSVRDENKPVQVFFPERKLKKPVTVSDEPPFEPDPECNFRRDGLDPRKVWPEGTSAYVSFESATAAIELSKFILRMTGRPAWVRQENSKAFRDGLDSCVISLGLGFSAVTWEAESHFVPSLFTIYGGPSPKATFPFLTDHFTLKRERKNARGKTISDGVEKIDVPAGKDLALIVRSVRAVGDTKEPQPWFICAGRTTVGTTVAAHYLTKHWRELLDLYYEKQMDLKKHSLAVVIQHLESTNPEYDMRMGESSELFTSAKIHCWDKDAAEPCIAFAVRKESEGS